MKKIILVVFMTTTSIFGQKLSKEQLTDKLSDKACECANKQEVTKENFELTLGLCLLEGINTFEKDVEKHYGKDVITNEKKMEELGYDVGVKMGAKCPKLFQFMLDEETDSSAVEEADLMISGKVTEIKSDQFLSFSIKEESGKTNQFILLNNFDNSFLLTDKILKANDSVDVSYYESEIYDSKLGKFLTFKILTDIIKK